MIFLGTGAAEMIPSPFCDCEICTHARQNRGIYYKKRSCFMVDETTVIDFGPDIGAACLEYGIDFCNLENILITHTHDDHLSFSNLGLLSMSRKTFDNPIHIYIFPEGYNWCMSKLDAFMPEVDLIPLGDDSARIIVHIDKAYEIHKVFHGKAFKMGKFEVFPFKANHKSYGENEVALNYILTDEKGKSLLYACDTGVYSEETLKLIAGAHLDYLIMECTFGSRKLEEGSGHLDVYHFIEMLNKLSQYNIIDENTKIYSTHLNHKHTFNHDDLQAYFNENSPYSVTVAWDGLKI